LPRSVRRTQYCRPPATLWLPISRLCNQTHRPLRFTQLNATNAANTSVYGSMPLVCICFGIRWAARVSGAVAPARALLPEVAAGATRAFVARMRQAVSAPSTDAASFARNNDKAVIERGLALPRERAPLLHAQRAEPTGRAPLSLLQRPTIPLCVPVTPRVVTSVPRAGLRRLPVHPRSQAPGHAQPGSGGRVRLACRGPPGPAPGPCPTQCHALARTVVSPLATNTASAGEACPRRARPASDRGGGNSL
jgi:hypothetical protein